MKALSKAVVTFGVVGLLAGCSTAPVDSMSAAREREIDMQKVAAVNAAARQAGVTILWVNPPTKSK